MRLCLRALLSVCFLCSIATHTLSQLQFRDVFGTEVGREALPPPPQTNGHSNLGSKMRPTDNLGGYHQPAPLQIPQIHSNQAPSSPANQSVENNWDQMQPTGQCNCGSCDRGTSLWAGYCKEQCSDCGHANDCCNCGNGLFGGNMFGRNWQGMMFGRKSVTCDSYECDSYGCDARGWDNLFCCPPKLGTFTMFAGIDSSKQPQDFGVNSNLGGLFRVNYAAQLFPGSSIGFQAGSSASFTGNAMQVYESLGESTDRFQSFNTVGIFQRTPIGFSWGAVYDFLYQDSFDEFYLGQVRVRASIDVGHQTEIGATFNISTRGDSGQFNNTTVYLDPIDQYHIYCRRYWQSGVNSACWIGIADEHSQENIVTGTLPVKNDTILFGADFMAPLNGCMALYGATNLMMPADTGAVDAFLGIEFSPQGIARSSGRTNPFRAYMPVAASPFFTTNLTR